MINIFKVQQNILFVCPTLSFGTRERMLLRDCLLLKSIGHNVFVYLVKDSFLEVECKAHGISVIHHQGPIHMNLWSWYKLKRLRTFLKVAQINIIHCYELNYIWPLAFFTRKMNFIALFFTLTGEIQNSYHQIWYKPLLARLDLVLIPVREMVDSVNFKLSIPQRKINFSGLGLQKVEDFDRARDYSFDSKVWNFGCWINDHEENEKDLETCLEAIWAVNTSFQLKKLAHLHLYSTRVWETNVITEKIKAKIKKYELEKFVHFHNEQNINEIFADVWISYSTQTPLEDYTIVSMLKNIPTIMTRNPTTSEICRIYGSNFLTYKASDSRELRSAMKELTSKISKQIFASSAACQDLWLEHGEEGYKYNLFRNYEKHLNKRLRFYS